MNTRIERRRRYFVDSSVQGALLRRLIGFWFTGMAAVSLVLFIYHIAPYWLSGKNGVVGQAWVQLRPLVFASAALLPFVFYSAIRFSNRFVGPMLRFRRVLKQLAHGEPTSRITLRKGDFWLDVADDINMLVEQLQPRESFPAHAQDEEATTSPLECPAGLAHST
jgi:hypothetical protein